VTLAVVVLAVCYFMAGAFFAFLTKLSLEDDVGGVWHNVKTVGTVTLVFLFWPIVFVLLAVMAMVDR